MCPARHRVPRTTLKTADTNLDCTFIKKTHTLLHSILDGEKSMDRIELVTNPVGRQTQRQHQCPEEGDEGQPEESRLSPEGHHGVQVLPRPVQDLCGASPSLGVAPQKRAEQRPPGFRAVQVSKVRVGAGLNKASSPHALRNRASSGKLPILFAFCHQSQ